MAVKLTKAEMADLIDDLTAHLEYCGWGDSLEREISEKLRERVSAFEGKIAAPPSPASKDAVPVGTVTKAVTEAKSVVAFVGVHDPSTRDGFYLSTKAGPTERTFFVGLNKTTGEMVYERVG